ncbi:alpha-1,3-galactosyltransferase 2-like isoform X5 [Cyprinodon tularosa]|uniref:alpha-1,3-galactosyltransferase 2-like isoform X5 n=1 Tax=Cyprinodon tularosa TaxID=77115 RepID=UPI0018E24364|nr:alpha-1,3-galactosyltransferase 2-like isoform X5 [Cyprinodon tularosa]
MCEGFKQVNNTSSFLPVYRVQQKQSTMIIQRIRSILKLLLFFPIAWCIMFYTAPSVRFLIGLIPMDECPLENVKMLALGNSADTDLNLWSRSDVQTCTTWNAPIIWEGMFNPSHYDQIHRSRGSSVALTVFAVGRYLDAYLEAFLKSSERYFMLSLPVIYYVFTDTPEKVPNIKLAPNRKMKVIRVEKHTRWQDISMLRMKSISDIIESDIRHHSTHVFCFDVDQVFTGRFGPEALGDTVALLHAFYYHLPKRLFTYDRNPKSKAFMKTGDFYYHAAVFGGSWKNVKALTEACYKSIMEDKENNVEALWHDESHLNKYFWLHKPSRILSPEYCWDTNIGYRADIRVQRLLWAPKNYDELRTL